MSLIDLFRGLVARISPAWRFGVGRLYLTEKKYEEAEKYLDPLLDMEAQEAGVSVGDFGSILFEVGRCAWETDRRERAMGIWQRVVSLAPLIPVTGVALCSIGMAKAAAGKIDEAINHFDLAIQADQRLGNSLTAVRYMYWAAGNLAHAGALAKALGFLDRALPILEARFPDETNLLDECLGLSGWIHQHLGHSPQAVKTIEKRLDALQRVQQPEIFKLASVYYDLACKYEDVGQDDLCLAALEEAETLSKDLSAKEIDLAGSIASCRGVVALNRSQYEEAVQFFEFSLGCTRNSRTPEHGISLNNLAYALIKARKRLDEAEEMLFEALSLVTEATHRRYLVNTLGSLAQVNGEYDWAEAIHHAAIECSTTPRAKADGLAFLGDVYTAVGRNIEAREAYQRALGEFDLAGVGRHLNRVAIEEKLRDCAGN